MPAPPPLWSDAFLEQEIREQPEYQAITRDSADFDAFVAAARTALASMQGVHEPDERTTIDRVIKPLLTALGWPGTLEELSLTSRDEVDLAIFSEAEEAERLLARSERDQVLGATGIVECKRWSRDFDRGRNRRARAESSWRVGRAADSALSADRRNRLQRVRPLGDPDQRRALAALFLPRPTA